MQQLTVRCLSGLELVTTSLEFPLLDSSEFSVDADLPTASTGSAARLGDLLSVVAVAPGQLMTYFYHTATHSTRQTP